MNPAALFDDLTRRGVHLEQRGEYLHVEAPEGILSDSDRLALRALKRELLALLAAACASCNASPANGGLDTRGEPWCSRCRDALGGVQHEVRERALEAGHDLAAAWRGAVRELGDLAGYPHLPFKPGHAVAPGAANWWTFIARASVPHLRMVVVALREFIAAMPRPGDPL